MLLRLLLALILIFPGSVLPGAAFANKNLLNSQQNNLADFAISEPDFLPVDEAYIFSSRVEGNDLVVRWEIADGYYLYKNRIKVASNEATTKFDDLVWSKDGKDKQDEYFGLVKVFYQDAEARIPVIKAVNGETSFTVTYQGCAEAGLCYPPQKRSALFFSKALAEANDLFPVTNDPVNNDPTNSSAGTINSNSSASSVEFTAANANKTADGLTFYSNSQAFMSLWLALGFAFLGGIILNLMPCVFPVLSLKALSLAKSSSLNHQENRLQALAYTAGVITLFTGIALALITLRAGGASIGWGFQLQSPWFVGLMVYLLFLIGLSLVGWLEPGSRLMGLGNELTQAGGKRGAFFTGNLAVVVASPCTAPFMGSALGYAITLPAAEALLVFVALGLGMSLPFLLLGFIPSFAKLLPKPGPWMATFKQLLAFPMFLSALWLLWVLGRQTNVEGMSIVLLGLITITFAIWLHKHAQSKPAKSRYLPHGIAIISLVFSLWVLGSQSLSESPDKIANRSANYQTFNANQIDLWKNSGKTVFVNVTADWCVSCLVNEKTVLSAEPVSSLLASDEIIYVKGDWTNDDPEITEYLASFGRNGVPLYVVYRSGQPPALLSQLLTTNEVVSALQPELLSFADTTLSPTPPSIH